MLSREENGAITQVGPGTPLGEMMRRYWIPVCTSRQIADKDSAPLRIRLLGEDLVAFRDTNGKVGVLDEMCMHRGASLALGRVEECGIAASITAGSSKLTARLWKRLTTPTRDSRRV